MKKYHLSLIAIIVISILGCTKGGSPTSSSTMTYSLGSIPNYSCTEFVTSTITVPVTITLESGTAGTMTVTPTGMPAGVTVVPAAFVGIPTVTTDFAFLATATTSGTFPITMTAASSAGSKSTTFNLVVSPGSSSSFTYTVTGVPASITLPQYSDTTISLPLSVGFVSGTPGTVALSGGTLPSGVTLFSASPASGTPTFSSTVSMHLAMNTPGTYPVVIKATAGSTTQSYTCNIIVTANSDCRGEVNSDYTNTNVVTSCSPALTPYPTEVVVSSTTTANQIELFSVAGGVTLYGTLSCSAGTISSITGSNVDFNCTAGSGTFTSSQIVVNYTLFDVNTSGTYTCTTTLTK